MALLSSKPRIVEPPPQRPTEVTSRSFCCIPGCIHCQSHRIYHWMCSECQGGPFKLQATDPGPYKVLRPRFEKTSQEYVMNHETGVGRWIYHVRRACHSPMCYQRIHGKVMRDEAELAQRRPDLAPAIQAKLEVEQAEQLDTQDDMATAFDGAQADLVPDPGQF